MEEGVILPYEAALATAWEVAVGWLHVSGFSWLLSGDRGARTCGWDLACDQILGGWGILDQKQKHIILFTDVCAFLQKVTSLRW